MAASGGDSRYLVWLWFRESIKKQSEIDAYFYTRYIPNYNYPAVTWQR